MYSFRKALSISLAMLATIMILTMMVGATPVQAAASSFTVSQKIPLVRDVFVPCANGGSGELVALTGTVHELFHVTLNGNGGFTLVSVANPQGVSGTGLTTGAKYQGTGVTSSILTGTVATEDTFIDNFRIIGQGPGNNFMVHSNVHITVNANGTLTAFVDNTSVVCK